MRSGFTQQEVWNALQEYGLSGYWANTSSNSLVGKLVREGSPEIKETMEDLMKGGKLCTEIDEQISLKKPNPSVCFYHGFVLGLMVELADRYVITSNRESGFGRYDVILKPRKKEDDAFILEFKVHDPDDEKTLQDTVEAALKQIEDMNYKSVLMEEGICEDRIRKYGFGFEGKRVLIG